MGKKEFMDYVYQRRAAKVKWVSLDFLGYENYSISNEGDVMNITTKRFKKKKANTFIELCSKGHRECFAIKDLLERCFS